MSNSKGTKEISPMNKLDQHPDFEELLRVERLRTESSDQKGTDVKKSVENKKETNPGPLSVEEELESFDDDYEDDLELDDEFLDTQDTQNDQDIKNSEQKKSGIKNNDSSDFHEVVSSIDENEGSESDQVLDDAMEFNFDETPNSSEGKPSEKSTEPTKKEPIKKSSGLFFYIIIIVVVVVCGGILYALMHKSSHPVVEAQQNFQKNTGFKPVLPEVRPLSQTLPPAIPQSTVPVTTSLMSNGSDEQILTDSPQNGTSGNAGITMLQLNRQQLLGLLSNFQKVVENSQKSLSDQILVLKTDFSTLTTSNAEISQNMDEKLGQMSAQMNQLNQKLDSYNQSISSIQLTLEKTQQQLKLILAEREQDIDHYTLRAIVPGRAWLVDGQGRTVTVILGEDLKNYGTVQELNDKMGFVTMSSGYVFK